MGAKASDKVLVTGQLMYLVERLRSVQGFNIKMEIPDDKGGVLFRMGHSMSWFSWGENITVNMYPYNNQQTVVEVKSECAMPTQIFDWGQNKQNVSDIMKYLLYGLNVQKMQ